MTIREVLEMLIQIYEALMTYLAPLFNKSEGEAEAPETTV